MILEFCDKMNENDGFIYDFISDCKIYNKGNL